MHSIKKSAIANGSVCIGGRHENNPSCGKSSIDCTPEIASLQHRFTPYGGEWIINQFANCEWRAVQEASRLNGECKAVGSVSLASRADAQSFLGWLGSHRRQRVREL